MRSNVRGAHPVRAPHVPAGPTNRYLPPPTDMVFCFLVCFVAELCSVEPEVLCATATVAPTMDATATATAISFFMFALHSRSVAFHINSVAEGVNLPSGECQGAEVRTNRPIVQLILQHTRAIWCRWRESNPHSLRNTILSRARLPIPPHRHRPSSIASIAMLGKAKIRNSPVPARLLHIDRRRVQLALQVRRIIFLDHLDACAAVLCDLINISFLLDRQQGGRYAGGRGCPCQHLGSNSRDKIPRPRPRLRSRRSAPPPS